MSNLETKKEVLEIKIQLIEQPELENFDKKNNSIKFDITNEVPLQMKSDITKMLSESTKKQLESITPFIQDVFKLQEVYTLKYDPDKKEESIEKYKELSKLTVQASVNAAFEPIYREAKNRVDEVNKMKKTFVEELKNKKLILDENFKEYLDEKLKESEDRKAKAEAKNNELKEKLAEAEAINKNQEIEKEILTSAGKITQINLSVSSSLNNLSLEGLLRLKENIKSYTIDLFVPKIEIPELKTNELKELFDNAIKSSLNLIEIKEKELKLSQENIEVKNENKVLNSQGMNVLDTQQVPNTYSQPIQNQQEVPQQNVINNQQGGFQQTTQHTQSPQTTSNPIVTPPDDYNKLLRLRELFNNHSIRMKELNDEFVNQITPLITGLQNEGLNKYYSKFLGESANKISDWMTKIMPWFNRAFEPFETFIKSNNNKTN